MNFTYLKTNNHKVNTAYYTAMSDLVANIKPFKGGLLKDEKPVIIAGIGYVTPWTRDAAINTSNAGSMFFPEISKNTLLAVLSQEDGKTMIDGEYWDRIIWVWGAWNYYKITGDREFLTLAYEATINTIEYLEETEYSESIGLFRGAACYGDGVAAYPDIYATPGESGIIAFAKECKDLCATKGVGLPMHSLSTNCLYYEAYVLADKMAEALNIEKCYQAKAEAIRNAINKHFWMEDKGYYRYLVDDFGGCEYHEGMGHSFVILFGIANKEQTKKVLENQYITKAGIPCVWPSFERYSKGVGRHSGTVWPHIQGFWSDAAAQNGRWDLFKKEFDMLTECSVRDGYFAELYHPETTQPYGGLQEFNKGGCILWDSEKKQTWSATAYLHMLFGNLAGINFKEDGIELSPNLNDDIYELEISNLYIRGKKFNIKISGKGSNIKECRVDGKDSDNFIMYDDVKETNIEIILE